MRKKFEFFLNVRDRSSQFDRDTDVVLQENSLLPLQRTLLQGCLFARFLPSSVVPVMPRKVVAIIKLAIEAGKANPAPPIGPALGQHGVNIMMFCKEYNAKTADQAGTVVPVEISVYEDRSFTFILKTPPAAVLIKKAAGIERGSGMSHTEKVGSITQAQLRQIAETKLPDLNTNNVEAAMCIIAGTARNMGVTVAE